MNQSETVDVLTAIAAYDLRTVGESDVIAWHAAIGELDKDLALEAVVVHHKTSADRVKPAHVIGIAKGLRRERAERENADTARRSAYEDARDNRLGIGQSNLALGGLPIPNEGQPVWSAYDEGVDGGAISRRCSHCGAEVDESCINPVNGKARRIPCMVRLTGKGALAW